MGGCYCWIRYIFPTLYIPVINHKAFKHTGISWEWGIVFIEAILFFAGVEAWKWAKRVYFRRQERKRGGKHDDLEKKAFAAYFMKNLIDMSCLLAWAYLYHGV